MPICSEPDLLVSANWASSVDQSIDFRNSLNKLNDRVEAENVNYTKLKYDVTFTGDTRHQHGCKENKSS